MYYTYVYGVYIHTYIHTPPVETMPTYQSHGALPGRGWAYFCAVAPSLTDDTDDHTNGRRKKQDHHDDDHYSSYLTTRQRCANGWTHTITWWDKG